MNPGDDEHVNQDNPAIPAGYTTLGQFIDHDITFDPTSHLGRAVDPEAIFNFRTPVLELDSVYGSGPQQDAFLYDRDSRDRDGARRGRIQFLIDYEEDDQRILRPDLPRNRQGTAIIGDPRNDENLLIAQLHLAFLKFHNAVVNELWGTTKDADVAFAEARRLVRWHYQWIVLHEFLPRIVGADLVGRVLTEDVPYEERNPKLKHEGRKFYDWKNQPFIPVEFSVGAYRFGHSQVRPGYRLNDHFAARLFPKPGNDAVEPTLAGGRRHRPSSSP
jgi:hypothetical protein